MQLGNFNRSKANVVSYVLYGIVLVFLLLYRLGLQRIFWMNSQLVAILFLGLGLLSSGVDSLTSLRKNENTINNSIYVVCFFLSGAMLTIGAIFLVIFQRYSP